MMMVSEIIAGDYKGCGIYYNKGLFGSGSKFCLTTKPGVGGKDMSVTVSKYTISSIEDMGSESKNSPGQAAFGALLFGPAGLLLGGNNQRHLVAIFWKDGKKSLADLNDVEYREIKKAMF